MITLRKITDDNYDDLLKLRVTEDQSEELDWDIPTALEHAKNGEGQGETLAIYKDELPIGLVKITHFKIAHDDYNHIHFGDIACYGISRFLIDENHQGRGYGKQGLLKTIDYIKTYPLGSASAISITYFYSNDIARKLYESVGFIETGEKWDGDTFEAWDESRTDDEEMAELGARLVL